MNKRYIALVSAALLLLNLSACGCQRSVTEETQAATVKATEEPTAAPTEFTLPEGEGVEELPVELEETVGTTEPTETATQPTEGEDETTATEPEETEPAETTAPTEAAGGESGDYCCKYAEYLTWSASAQQNFMNTFASPMDYINWCRAGEAAHAEHDTSIKVEGGNLDVGDYLDKTK